MEAPIASKAAAESTAIFLEILTALPGHYTSDMENYQ